MTQRTHECLVDGHTDEYDALGFRYTEGNLTAELLHPDSQHMVQSVELGQDELEALHTFLGEVVALMKGYKPGDKGWPIT